MVQITIEEIHLSPEEIGLYKRIEFDLRDFSIHREYSKDSQGAARELILSLVNRKVIPKFRLQFMNNPDHNFDSKVRINKQSRWKNLKDRFENIDDYFKSREFLRYLYYFIHGPDLRQSSINNFLIAVMSIHGDITSGDIGPLSDIAIRETKSTRMDKFKASDEFYKLGLECGMGMYSGLIRERIRKIRQ
jgi:hypothetical protein